MSMRVLIAETDWRFAEQATRYLEAHAHDVVYVSRAEDVTSRLRTWRADLVIVSADLAEGTLLRTLQAGPNRPAILLTAWMDRFDLAWRAWQSGGDELLMKPVFTLDDFEDAVRGALQNAAAGKRGGANKLAASA